MTDTKNTKRVAFLIRSYERPEYLRETLTSVLQSDIDLCAGRYIYDDCSKDPSVHNILNDPLFTKVPGKEFVVITGNQRMGCEHAYIAALSSIHEDYDYICTIDNDVHVKPNWIQTFLNTYDDAFATFHTRQMLVTGFNPSNAHKNIRERYDTFYRKRSCGGVSYFFHTEFKKYIMTNWSKRLDWGVCDAMHRDNLPLVCVHQSIVQHIGKHGINSHGGNHYDHDTSF